MSGDDVDGPPVFVDDSGHRQRLVRAVAVAVAIVGMVAALATREALTSIEVAATPAVDTSVLGAAVTSGRPGPFAVDTTPPRPDAPPAACRTVSGVVFADLDLNGRRHVDTEPPVRNVVVEVTDDAGSTVVTTTDDQGRYVVELDRPSAVRVQFRGRQDQFMPTPVGPDVAPWVSFPTDGPDCRVDTSAVWKGWFAADDPGITREIGDRLWLDTDGDGVQDPGEPGLPGIALDLVELDGTVVASTTTAADGSYRFAGLRHDRRYAVVLADPSDSRLGWLRPTAAWTGSTFAIWGLDTERGATDRDSSHWFDELDRPYLLVPRSEPGRSDHSLDLGFTSAQD